MNTSLKLVLLINTNRVSNFFNRLTLEKSRNIKNIVSLDNCLQALDFIDPAKTISPLPDIIFLSLYTPFMNGWEFLEKYDQLQKTNDSNVVILHDEELLREEEHKLNQYPFVKAVIKKNMNEDVLNKVYNKINRKEELQLIS